MRLHLSRADYVYGLKGEKMLDQSTLTLYHCGECGGMFITEQELLEHKMTHLRLSGSFAPEQKHVPQRAD